MTDAAIREHEEITKVKSVACVELGKHRMECWYYSPFPREFVPHYPEETADALYFCDFCLKFFRFKSELQHHASKCQWRHPPGDEIYRGDDGIGMWEVDGARDPIYCQNLSYLAKSFLDHKNLWWETGLFDYYVMTERDEKGHHIVGYFSKEKSCEAGYNLACILAFPAHQRKGYGRFLIQFSYELSRIEQRVGSPEVPISDLGQLAYKSYWAWRILGHLVRLPATTEVTVADICLATSIKPQDVKDTLVRLGILQYSAQAGSGVQGSGAYYVTVTPEAEAEFKRLDAKPGPVVSPGLIRWAPRRSVMDRWAYFTIRNRESAAIELQ
jgi:histone acetyltransferase MYST1